MRHLVLIPAVIYSLLTPTFACDIHGKTGFMPDVKLKIPPSVKMGTSMTKEKFEAITKKVADVYAPVVEAKGAKLVMVNDWEDGTINAYADQQGDVWEVHMYGGLARHPLTTDDGFMLVVCHEVGHHLGGFPKYGSTDWASNEGQADYFGTLKCMKRVLENEDNVIAMANIKIDAEAVKSCEARFKDVKDIALCERIAMAGKSLGSLLGALGGTLKVAFETPDKSVVKKTNDAHPKAQCRLDTYFAGALCDKPWQEDFSDKSGVPGACVQKDGYKKEVRSLCWYKPEKEEL